MAQRPAFPRPVRRPIAPRPRACLGRPTSTSLWTNSARMGDMALRLRCSSIAAVAGRPAGAAPPQGDSDGARAPVDRQLARADVMPMHRTQRRRLSGGSARGPQRAPRRHRFGTPWLMREQARSAVSGSLTYTVCDPGRVPPRANSNATASIAPATASSTTPSTSSPSPRPASTRPRASTSPAAKPTAKPIRKPSAPSNASSSAASSHSCGPLPAAARSPLRLLPTPPA
jgi:hypothetical protein